MTAYYNEIDAYAAQWLRNLIAAGHIAPGDVDERSIVDVSADDLKGYTQCHFFAGIGGWSLAARLAGWPDGRELWTGSCPCQPFSLAGKVHKKGKGTADARHLWPEFFRLIRAIRPSVVMGEQVPSAIGQGWLDAVANDMAGAEYAFEAAVLSSAPITRNHDGSRLYFVSALPAHRAGRAGQGASVSPRRARQEWPRSQADMQAVIDAPMQPGECHPQPIIRLDHDGLPASVVKARTRGAGNAISPQVAAEVIGAFLESERAAS